MIQIAYLVAIADGLSCHFEQLLSLDALVFLNEFIVLTFHPAPAENIQAILHCSFANIQIGSEVYRTCNGGS